MRQRDPDVVMSEAAAHLAYLATEAIYGDQPELWDLGEKGRHHTMDDFRMHFSALATGTEGFRSHVEYSYELFRRRGFPTAWLDDAWRYMEEVMRIELPGEVADAFVERLRSVTGGVAHG